MALPLRRKQCWFCRRIGRFGFIEAEWSSEEYECKKGSACLDRYNYRNLVETLRTSCLRCPDCLNLPEEGPGIVPSYTAAGWNGRGPDGDPCDSDFHPENGYVL